MASSSWAPIANVAVLVGLLAGGAAPAEAQAPLERAREAADRAAFADAIALYDEAAAGDGLDRGAVLELLEGRALARHATRDVAGAEEDLTALLSLAPDAELSDRSPPSLRRALERLRGEVRATVSVEASAAPIPDGFELTGRAIDDLGALVREIRFAWRVDGAWERASGSPQRVVAGARLEWLAEAVGPGGAVLARSGSEDAPTVTERASAIAEVAVEGGRASSGEASDDTGLHWGIGIGVGLAIAAGVAVVLAFVLAPEPDTQPSAPMELP